MKYKENAINFIGKELDFKQSEQKFFSQLKKFYNPL